MRSTSPYISMMLPLRAIATLLILASLHAPSLLHRNYQRTATRIAAAATLTHNPFFNPHLLNNPGKMNAILKKEGFTEGYFHTPDKLRIHYLFKERPAACYNVIFCCGWWPGRKESLATFYKILRPDCNVLFFDARGHGRSGGSMFTAQYGCSEYNDIIGAIQFLHKKTGLPTLIHGICAGAFNAAHALAKLQKKDALTQYNVKGLIFDSGWTSVTNVSRSTPYAHLCRKARRSIGKLLGYKHRDPKVEETFLMRAARGTISALCTTLHTLIVRPFVSQYEHETNLHSQIATIPIPILFIHGYDDAHAPITETKELIAQAVHPSCWLIEEPSRHGCHHLKHTDNYRSHLHAFIDKALAT